MSVEAFILIGGRSSRLGRPKALERVGGQTLAERALRAVRDSRLADKITFVTGSEVEFAIEAARLDALFVFDLIEGRGPLGGLYTALSHAAGRWVFILACDLPFVTAELICRLSEFRDNECGAVVPEQPDGRLQPLCSFYNAAITRPVVEEIIRRPRPSPPMREVIDQLNPRIVEPAEYDARADWFANINTEEDLRSARRQAEGS